MPLPNTPSRVVFLGTSTVAVRALEALLGSRCEIVAVYTKPDREAGRGRRLHASPVKTSALAHDLALEQPGCWDRAACRALAELRPDLVVVVDYGMILPEAVLGVPRLGCVNLHLSLLPRWRGAAPVARAIEAGDKETGVSLIRLVPALDAGPVVVRRGCPIEAHDTGATLGDKLARLGAGILGPFMRDAERLLAAAEPQREDEACYARKLVKEEAWVDWRGGAEEIERKIRALNPWPVAQTRLGELTVRVWEGEARPLPGVEPGRIDIIDKRLLVHCGRDALAVRKLQPPGKRVMSDREFLNGYEVGKSVLGGSRPGT